jgi:hypothetical protein
MTRRIVPGCLSRTHDLRSSLLLSRLTWNTPILGNAKPRKGGIPAEQIGDTVGYSTGHRAYMRPLKNSAALRKGRSVLPENPALTKRPDRSLESTRFTERGAHVPDLWPCR